MLSSLFVIYKVNQIEKTYVLAHNHVYETDFIQLELPEPEPPEVEVFIPIISQEEVLCLQKNMYFEARDQGAEGMIGVAWVTFNRVNSDSFPRTNTICEVVYKARTDSKGNPIRNKCQFSWYCDGLKDVPDLHNNIERNAWEMAGDIARNMILSCIMEYNGEQCPDDLTHGSVFYHSDTVEPEWTYVKTVKIDNHQYYRLASE